MKLNRVGSAAAGAEILEHQDYKLNFEDGIKRIYIPIEANPQVEFWLTGKLLQIREGEAWYLNLNLPHSVNNNDTAARVHLVVDFLVNDWMQNIFLLRAEKAGFVSCSLTDTAFSK